MKKVYLLSVLILLLSCKKDIEDNFVENITHHIEVNYGEYFENKVATGVSINLKNLQTGSQYQTTSDQNGKASIQLPMGIYDIVASQSLNAQQMKAISGEEKEANFNATLTNVIINKEKNDTSVLSLVTGKVGNLLIKQVYYTGSDTKRGAADRDQFFEIHNNSNENLYLDNLCFAMIFGWNTAYEKVNLLENGQFDWRKSPTLLGEGNEVNTNFTYAYEVISFPGNGSEYPLESGKSVIVARSAQNHKAPLTVGGKTYEVPEPERTINLLNAKFEVYYAEHQKAQNGNDRDIDNPNVVNMNLDYKVNTNYDLILNVQGRDAYVIFYKTTDFDNWKRVQSPAIRRKKAETRAYLQIPNEAIIDGVNLQDFNNKLAHRLVESIDAGELESEKGAGSSESFIRKEKKRIGDKIFYQDTNNSSNDFQKTSPDVSSLN